jgi:Delta7-sterol 5-desaturase
MLSWIWAPGSIWGSFVVLTIGGVIFYYVTSGLSYLYFLVWRKDRYFPNETPNPEQMKKERRWALYSLVGNAAFTAPIHHAIVEGKSQIYFGWGEHSFGYFLFTIFIFLMVTECLVYWAHRALHHPILYKHIHLHHHQFRVTTPWASVAFHPLDSFMQAAPTHLCAFLFPVHISVYATFLVFLTLWSVFIHERVTFVRVGIVNYTMHHTVHHKFNKYNYGQFLTLWDRLMGTHKHPVGLVEDGLDTARAQAMTRDEKAAA